MARIRGAIAATGFDPKEEAATVEAHLSRRPDASDPCASCGAHRRMLLGADVPVVEVRDMTETPIDLCVGFSHAASGWAVADFAREAGYMRAAAICAGDERAQRRLAAFAESFGQSSCNMVPVGRTGSGSLAAGRAMLVELLHQHGFARGLLACSSDVLAQGVLIEAAARRLSVPRDLAVVGFGDQEMAAAVEPGLTTVRVNREAMGRVAAQALLERIGGEEPRQSVIEVGFTLIRRASA